MALGEAGDPSVGVGAEEGAEPDQQTVPDGTGESAAVRLFVHSADARLAALLLLVFLAFGCVYSLKCATHPLLQLNAYREVLDPRNILANDWLNAVCPSE